MIKVEVKNRNYDCPSTWNELSGKQLVAIMKVFASNLSLLAAGVRLFKILTGISWFRMRWIGPSHYDDKLYLTDWLLQENNLTKNTILVFRGYYGPADNFNTLQVSEFVFTEQFYRLYKEGNSIDHLNTLIAILYRPAKIDYDKRINPDGDVREPYNDNLTQLYVHRVARWPMSVRQAIVHWYEGCRVNLVNNNPDVYGGAGGEDPLYGLFSVMRGVADKGIHGDLDKVGKMYVKVFLMELNEMVAEGRRVEAAAKKAT